MARPPIEFWIVYEAIIDFLAHKILETSEICNRSFSIRKFRNNKMKRVTSAWLEFDSHSRELYKKGYKYCVVADEILPGA